MSRSATGGLFVEQRPGELWRVGHMPGAVTLHRLATEYTTTHRVTEALVRETVEWDILIPTGKSSSCDFCCSAPAPRAVTRYEPGKERQ